MKGKHVLTSCLIVAGLFAASVTLAQNKDALKVKIDKLNNEYATAMVTGNIDQLTNLYAIDAISLPSYEPMQDGISAIRKSNLESIKRGEKITSFDLNSVKIITAGNLVTDIGTYKISLKMPGVDKMIDDHGKYLTILEKQKDGSLKIKVETWNTDVDPMSMMNKDQQSSK